MKKRYIIGVILIALGVLLGLDRLNILNFNDVVYVWWPVIFIVFGLQGFFNKNSSRMWSVILLVIGIILLINNVDFIPEKYLNLIWPIMLVIMGVAVIFPAGKSYSSRDEKGDVYRLDRCASPIEIRDDQVECFAAFSGIDARVASNEITGGNVTALFGGADIDLRDAKILKDGAYMDVTAVFGGVDIKVPVEWKVIVTGIPLFGGWENRTRLAKTIEEKDAPTLKLKCFAMFGGIEISN